MTVVQVLSGVAEVVARRGGGAMVGNYPLNALCSFCGRIVSARVGVCSLELFLSLYLYWYAVFFFFIEKEQT